MNYEEKYNEALERAKLYNNEILTEIQREMLQTIFPELKESEEERIRKTLVAFFKDWNKTRSHCWSVPVVNIIAWLEKQGKTLDADRVIEWLTWMDERIVGILKLCGCKKPNVTNSITEQFKKDFGL